MSEPERKSVITVRLPIDLHERLKTAAHAARVSLNKFCEQTLAAAAPESNVAPAPFFTHKPDEEHLL